MRAAVSVCAALLLSACGRYADFTLPPPNAAGPRAPFTWEESPAPVLSRGVPGAWDAVDVLNPSVVRFEGAYLNFYSGYDGHTWRTGLARSVDGITWNKKGDVLSPQAPWEGTYIAANGSALVASGTSGSEILYWYVAGVPPRIGLARSRDGGRTWVKQPQPVVPLGPRGSFDERGVADPDVIRRGDFFYMFYLGQDRARRQRLGVARSRDGVVWEKLRSNPVLDLGGPGSFDEGGLGEPAVWTSGGSYWMLYTGRERAAPDGRERRRTGLARSSDGVHWERDPGFTPLAGSQAWDSQVLCDPSVEIGSDGGVTSKTVRVWFGGGDVPHPVENIHGQIGVGVLRGQ